MEGSNIIMDGNCKEKIEFKNNSRKWEGKRRGGNGRGRRG
jgi:hypothetical protein